MYRRITDNIHDLSMAQQACSLDKVRENQISDRINKE